jgi:hypothetical protein
LPPSETRALLLKDGCQLRTDHVDRLAVLIWKTTHSLDPYRPPESKVAPVNVEVVALNWKWLFIYPDYGVATVNYPAIPLGTPINFRLTSESWSLAIATVSKYMSEKTRAAEGGRASGMGPGSDHELLLHLPARQPDLCDGRDADLHLITDV